MRATSLCMALLLLVGSLTLFAQNSVTIHDNKASQTQSVQKPTATIQRNQGISQVLKARGCNPGWLATVMTQSGIKIEDLRRLPRGTKLILVDNCSKEPPAEATAFSNMIMQFDGAKHHRTKAVQQRAAAAAKGSTGELAKLKSENEGLKKALAERDARLKASQNQPTLNSPLQNTGSSRPMLWSLVAGLSASLFVVLAGLAWIKWKNLRSECDALKVKNVQLEAENKTLKDEIIREAIARNIGRPIDCADFKAEMEKPDIAIALPKVVQFSRVDKGPLIFKLNAVDYACGECDDVILAHNLHRHQKKHQNGTSNGNQESNSEHELKISA